MMILDPPDACPSCQPGIPDAALPLSVTEAGDGRVADYQCASCGTAWTTLFDRHGWVVERLIAPVATDASSSGWPVSREAA